MTRWNRATWLAAGGLAAALLPLPRSAAAQAPGAPAPSASVPGAGAPVTLHLRDTPLRTALEMLFEGSGLQYAVEPTVTNIPITLDVRDVPFPTALRTLLRLAPGTTFRKEGEVTIIGLRQPTPERNGYEVDQPAPPETVASADPNYAEKIPIKYLHPAILAYILNGRLIPTEDQVQPGFGGPGGYNGGGNYGGLNGGGGYGYPGGNGLGPTGSLGLPGGNLNGLNQGGFQGGNNPYGNFGNSNGLGSNTYINGANGSVVVGPTIRRF
jgi:hypothetical protein